MILKSVSNITIRVDRKAESISDEWSQQSCKHFLGMISHFFDIQNFKYVWQNCCKLGNSVLYWSKLIALTL